MSRRYPGGVVSATAPTVTAAGASGLYGLTEQTQYQGGNKWPPFKIGNSLRLRSSATAYLSRTPSSTGNQKTWTWSAWIKRGALGVDSTLLHSYDGSSSRRAQFYFDTSNNFVMNQGGSSSSGIGTSSAVFRDVSSWYHIVLVANYSSSAFTFYVNGVAQAMTYSTAINNENGLINGTSAHQIGSQTTSNLFDGYMAEINFVDGQALTPSSFGGTDKNGIWSPIAYTGSYGTNGFYLPFNETTSATTLGYDKSGNGNNWTLSGFNVSTANTTYDIVNDAPVDQQSGDVSRAVGNYCTWNPLNSWNGSSSTAASITNGNLFANLTATGNPPRVAVATIPMGGSGKVYFEIYISALYAAAIGIVDSTRTMSVNQVFDVNYNDGGDKTIDGTNTSYGSSYTSGDTIGCAVDFTNNQITFYKNGVSQGDISYTMTGKTYIPFLKNGGGGGTTAGLSPEFVGNLYPT